MPDDDHQKTDWTAVDALATTRAPRDLARAGSHDVIVSEPEGVTGIVQRLKERRIKRHAAVKALETATSAQLEVIAHQVQEAARVKKAEATVLADQLLKDLDLQFQQVLSELGVRNEAIRRATLTKLNDETARDLREFANKDWPDFMRQASIEMVTKRWQRFISRLGQDIEEEGT